MAPPQSKKRKADEAMKRKPKKMIKKFKKQTDYDNQSSSESEAEQEPQITTDTDFQAVNLQESDDEGLDTTLIATNASDDDEPVLGDAEDSEVTDASNSDSDDEDGDDSDAESNPNLIRKRKRNDPEAFATSMSKILGSKLSTAKRSDPVLSRSVNAIQASKEITDMALEKKAKSKMRDDRKAALDKGRVKDVLGASTAFDAANGKGDGISVQAVMMEEKRHRKTAQRGVVHLFNAVRAAQVKGEAAAREARQKGVVGTGRREERINEMSKKGFLDLIAGGGNVEEA